MDGKNGIGFSRNPTRKPQRNASQSFFTAASRCCHLTCSFQPGGLQVNDGLWPHPTTAKSSELRTNAFSFSFTWRNRLYFWTVNHTLSHQHDNHSNGLDQEQVLMVNPPCLDNPRKPIQLLDPGSEPTKVWTKVACPERWARLGNRQGVTPFSL